MDQMEKLNQYRRIVQQVLHQHAANEPDETGTTSTVIGDSASDNYKLIDIERDAEGAEHQYLVAHLQIADGRVLILDDGIEYGIASDLLTAGIAEEDIYLAIGKGEPRPLRELVAA